MWLLWVVAVVGSPDPAALSAPSVTPISETAGQEGAATSPSTSDVLLDQAERVANVLSGPSPMLAFSNTIWALGAAMKANNLTWGTWGAFANAFYALGIVGLPASYVLPYFIKDEGQDPNHVPTSSLGTQVYLLNFTKKSALTGQLKRQPTGAGIGWELSKESLIRKYGVIYGGEGIYQQTTVDSSDWATVYNMFMKLDLRVGWNAAAVAGYFLGSSWLERQELSVRVGPSYFRNWVGVADEGSGLFQDPGEMVGTRATLVNGFGYELSALAAVDFGLFGGASFTYQRGSYPSLSFGEQTPESAALLVLVGFDDLRRGDNYTWERMRGELNVPFTGFARSGSFNIAASLSTYKNDEGTSVSNRGFSLGGSWRF